MGGGKIVTIKGRIATYDGANPFTDIPDYKFFCFNGKPEYFKIDFGRFVSHHANYYNANGRLMPFGEAAYPPIPEYPIKLPDNIKEMVALAEKLSQGFPFIRVDLYNCNGCIYFGELTFFPASGMGRIEPEQWDRELGKLINLESLE